MPFAFFFAVTGWGWVNPNVALLLILLGVFGIYAEFVRPGSVAPGAVGSVLLLLGMTTFTRWPLDWRAVLLIALSLASFPWSAGARRGKMVLAACGAAGLDVGLMLLRRGSGPHINGVAAIAFTALFTPATVYLLSTAKRARRNKSLS